MSFKYVTLFSAALFLTACGSSEAEDLKSNRMAYVDAQNSLVKELPALSGDHVWDMSESQSRLGIEAYYNGNFFAEFPIFQTVIRLNPDDLSDAEIHAIVDLRTFGLAKKNSEITSNLTTADWLATDAHPYARFTSSDVSQDADGNYVANGEMTIKGQTRPAVLNFTLTVTEDEAEAFGTITVNRMDYGVGSGSDFQTEDWVRFPVKIETSIIALR